MLAVAGLHNSCHPLNAKPFPPPLMPKEEEVKLASCQFTLIWSRDPDEVNVHAYRSYYVYGCWSHSQPTFKASLIGKLAFIVSWKREYIYGYCRQVTWISFSFVDTHQYTHMH